MTLFEGEFVCAGCGETFPRNLDGQVTLDDGRDEKRFHSAACMTAWNERQGP
jgi:hypothetical protein